MLADEVDRLMEANATLTRILGAIEEYVYSSELLPGGGHAVRFAGPCRERFLGLSVESARDAVWVDYVHPDELDLFRLAHEDARRTGGLDVQYRLVGADGRVRWVRDRGRVHRAGGRVFLDGSVLDVTALRQAEDRLTEHVRDVDVLATAHRELALSPDPASARRAVCRAVRIVCGATGVGLYEPRGAELVLIETDGRIPCSSVLPAGETSGTARAYRAGERRFVADAATSDQVALPAPGDAAMSSVLFEPVRSAGSTVGVVTVVWDDPVAALPARVEALLPLLVAEVGVALERANLVDQLSAAARTDPLTGLPNRRALDDLVPRELERAGRSGLPLCLAVLDLDHFKAYNDTYGHPAGDLVLREAGQRWRRVLRVGDALVRYGGEEFLVVLPGCDPDGATRLLDVLRRATPRAQTCSIGVARWDGEESAAALLHRADQAMYRAKAAGRDRVVAAEGAQDGSGTAAQAGDGAVTEG